VKQRWRNDLKNAIATVLHFATRFSAPHEYVASRINRGTKRAESVDVTISPSPWKKNVKFRRCGECHGAEYRRRRRRCTHVETAHHDEYLNK